jgi:hypothetical protein
MPVSKAQIRKYANHIKQLQQQSMATSNETRLALHEAVTKTRRACLDRFVATVGGPKNQIPMAALGRLSSDIRAEVTHLFLEAKQILEGGQREAFQAGVRASFTLAVSLEMEEVFFSPSTVLLQAAIRHSAMLINSIEDKYLPRVDALIGRAAIGAYTPLEAMKELDLILGRVGAAKYSVTYESERIIRTEVPRLYSIALDEQMQSMASRLSDEHMLKKTWRSGPMRPGRREEHQEIDGVTIPVNEDFIVTRKDGTTVPLRYPRDPEGPADQTIFCG